MNSKNKVADLEPLRDLVTRLTVSSNALAALALFINQRITGNQPDPFIQPYINEVIDALGMRESLENANASQLVPVLAEIQMAGFQLQKAFGATPEKSGWTHSDQTILKNAGEVSMFFPHILKQLLMPRLTGLAERLDSPDAAFLDIGVGIAAMSIEMARLWPSLRIVGIDIWKPSLTLARENVRNAGFENRIELREQKAEDLTDENVFDLIWIPSVFIPMSSISEIVNRVHKALRPNGWVLFGMAKSGADPLGSSIVRLRTAQWGGCIMSSDQAESLLSNAGFADVQTMPSPPNALITITVGRRG
jgi:2-polyprenyl-3-methyl-5-hydroxy-6-metoxy-1,4-benzoquinol methylase